MNEGTLGGIAYSAGRWPPDPARPTVVFLHGSGGSRVLWQGQIGALDEVVNTVAVDLPGHGESTGSGCDSIAAYGTRVMEFVRVAALPRPVPCGLSLGGAVTLQLLLDRGEELYAGILVSTGARLRVARAVFAAIEADYPGFVASLPDLAASPETPPERLGPLLAAMAQTPPEVTEGDFRACDRFDVMARLNEVACPVLVVSAADDRLTPPRYADHLESHLRGACRVHLERAGHLVPLERPQAFNAAVRGFLSQLTGPVRDGPGGSGRV